MPRLEKLLTAITADNSRIIGLASFLHYTIPNVFYFILMDSDSIFTLPVNRNKSETPKIIQIYLERLRLDRLLGDIDKRMMS